MSALLDVEHVGVSYGPRRAIDDVSFSVGRGELIGVVGPNGAGKSTLFRALCGLVPHDGHVAMNGAHCHHRADRMDIAYVPQRSDLDLGFPVSVGQLVASGRRRFRTWWRPSGRSDRAAADTALDRVGLPDVADRSLTELSGGQLQRAFIARALTQEARVMLLDEALSGVDDPATDSLLTLFADLCTEGTSILVASHDLAVVRRRTRRCLAINGGLRADGHPATVLTHDTLDSVFGSATPTPAPVHGRTG
jgi:ABC-type Mn2+/Zn2+ transport system ATPase subunit